MSYAEDALARIYEPTEGYACFLQEHGRRVWLVADEARVTRARVEFAHPVVQQYLDASIRSTSCAERFLCDGKRAMGIEPTYSAWKAVE